MRFSRLLTIGLAAMIALATFVDPATAAAHGAVLLQYLTPAFALHGAPVGLAMAGVHRRGQDRLIDGNTFSFTSGQRQTVQVPVPSMFINRLLVWLRGTMTVSGVTVPGTVHADGPVNLISQLELLLDGFPLKLGSGGAFFRNAQKYDQTDGVNNGLAAAAAGVYNFEALVPIMFAMPSSVNPWDTVLDGRQFRNLVLNLTWGTTASMIYGNTSTLALTNTTAQIYIRETEPFPVKGDRWLFRESETTFAGILTSGGTRLLLPFTQGGVVRSHQLRAIDGSDLSDAVINQLTFRVNGGEQIPVNQLEDDFQQALGQHDFGMDTMPDGYYHVEHSEGGRVITTGLGAGAAPGSINSIEYIADTTVGVGATSIVVHTNELLPPKS